MMMGTCLGSSSMRHSWRQSRDGVDLDHAVQAPPQNGKQRSGIIDFRNARFSTIEASEDGLLALALRSDHNRIFHPPGRAPEREYLGVIEASQRFDRVSGAATSAFGTFETSRRTVTMSVYGGRPEVIGTRTNRRD